MKRLSRHTVVVLLVMVVSSLGGMSVAVVAFGQSGGDPDATVPLGDYTGTTPSSSTTPLSSYTTTTNTTATTIAPTQTTQTQTSTAQSAPTTTNGTAPSRTHGSTTVPNGSSGGALPSRATRSGPTHLAFTGGEPLLVGAFGMLLMGGGVVLHRRRRGARG
jgi:cobalamin biosynthesis Mg chelatase CobN